MLLEYAFWTVWLGFIQIKGQNTSHNLGFYLSFLQTSAIYSQIITHFTTLAWTLAYSFESLSKMVDINLDHTRNPLVLKAEIIKFRTLLQEIKRSVEIFNKSLSIVVSY